jgi:hypothetical protein
MESQALSTICFELGPGIPNAHSNRQQQNRHLSVVQFGTSHSYQQELGARVYKISNSNIFTVIDYSHYFGQSHSIRDILTSPDLKVDYPIGQLVLGLDNQYLIVPQHNAYSLAATFGIRF